MKKVIFYSYPKCSTCRKASKWLEQNNISYQFIDIVQEPPSIRSQNERFNKLFLKSYNFKKINRESTNYLDFCDVVFKFIDNNFRKFDSKYKFDGLSYTILNDFYINQYL